MWLRSGKARALDAMESAASARRGKNTAKRPLDDQDDSNGAAGASGVSPPKKKARAEPVID